MDFSSLLSKLESQPPLLLFVVGLLLGAVVAAWVVSRRAADRERAERQRHEEGLQHEIAQAEQCQLDLAERLRRSEDSLGEMQATRERLAADLSERSAAYSAAAARLEAQREQSVTLQTNLAQRDKSLLATQRESATRQARISELETLLAAERESAAEKLKLLENAREQLSTQFRNLANQILEEKSEKFTAQNREQLGHLLNPLREQLGDFRKRVDDVYDKETRDRSDLKAQIERLGSLNERISKDAINLTNALKGESKTQGSWGEVVLERVLEDSGLRLGHEYRREVVLQGEDGSRLRPDVIIDLPEERHIVVDSKVSLTAYERATSAEDEGERQAALREHVASLRNHVRGLDAKGYASLHGLKSLDFVLLFIPIEGAFHAALAHDGALYADAYKQNIVLVSPTTLLATCRTIENIWRIEQQNRNADEIARQAGAMLDKFNGFVTDLEKVGDQLERAQQAYLGARNKLDQGRGNLLRSAHRIADLGVKSKKALPEPRDADTND